MTRKKLLWQLFPSYILIAIVSLVAITWYSIYLVRNIYIDEKTVDLKIRAHLIEDQVLNYLNSSDFHAVDSLCKAVGQKSSTRVTIILPDGLVIADSDNDPKIMDNHLDRPEVQEALKGNFGSSTRFSHTLNKDLMYVAVPLKANNSVIGIIRTSVPITFIEDTLSFIQFRIIIIAIVLGIILTVMSLFFSRNISQPLKEDILRLRRLENVRRDFVANVSHEIRTPLTSIKGFAETLLDGAISSANDARNFIKIILKQANRLNAIIEDLLTLARLEEQEERSYMLFEEKRLERVLYNAKKVCLPSANNKDSNISLVCNKNLKIKMNKPLLEQAVINLIDNAIKYSPNNSNVEVSAHISDKKLEICVKDQGSGIAEEHLPRIFERFYRVDKARSRAVGGTGLGLSIVKHIAQVHGGQVSVESELGLGSTFKINLPL